MGGYQRKLDDVEGEFLFCVCKDENMNDFKKLFDMKRKLRSLSGIKRDYNFIHSSNTLEEFVRQLTGMSVMIRTSNTQLTSILRICFYR